MAAKKLLVRIKPSNKRDHHHAYGVGVYKKDGWCSIDADVAKKLAAERMSDINPEASAFVFDVLDPEEARATAEAETIREEPAGTVDKPKEKPVRRAATPAAER